ncbi:MAG: hypothetical protein KAW45_02165 [Thermoplasmatales archaeon]|nr:hypothetical protein [Thermoplasmatales archaeon]
MKKIILILTLLVGGILVLSGFGVATVTNNLAIMDNHPPNKPTITGPTSGIVGEEYDFCFVAEDPENDNVSFYIEWADGTSTGWTVFVPSGYELIELHAWSKMDVYTIRAKAKDIYDKESDWSYLDVPISKNKAYSDTLLLRFLEQFPMLERLLNLL